MELELRGIHTKRILKLVHTMMKYHIYTQRRKRIKLSSGIV